MFPTREQNGEFPKNMLVNSDFVILVGNIIDRSNRNLASSLYEVDFLTWAQLIDHLNNRQHSDQTYSHAVVLCHVLSIAKRSRRLLDLELRFCDECLLIC